MNAINVGDQQRKVRPRGSWFRQSCLILCASRYPVYGFFYQVVISPFSLRTLDYPACLEIGNVSFLEFFLFEVPFGLHDSSGCGNPSNLYTPYLFIAFIIFWYDSCHSSVILDWIASPYVYGVSSHAGTSLPINSPSVIVTSPYMSIRDSFLQFSVFSIGPHYWSRWRLLYWYM